MRYYKPIGIAVFAGAFALGCAAEAGTEERQIAAVPATGWGSPDLDLGPPRPDLVGQPSGQTGCMDARVVHRLPNGTVARFARFSPDSRSLVMQVAPASGEPS